MGQGRTADESRNRQRAQRRGHFAERFAALSLQLRGWRILKRRYKTKAGEIDLIAKRGKTVAFIEVKARRTLDAAMEAVTPSSQRRIVKAAKIFVAEHPKAAFFTLRFDVVIVRPWRWPEWIRNAFEARD
ncbi:YraN family protein [Roseibium sp.]|uniref:YraN family protein n=1 Tax=Roseibium sp. TaxID=1936156 RepID=UPI003A9741F6